MRDDEIRSILNRYVLRIFRDEISRQLRIRLVDYAEFSSLVWLTAHPNHIFNDSSQRASKSLFASPPGVLYGVFIKRVHVKMQPKFQIPNSIYTKPPNLVSRVCKEHRYVCRQLISSGELKYLQRIRPTYR
jgi:hypothetical protein